MEGRGVLVVFFDGDSILEVVVVGGIGSSK